MLITVLTSCGLSALIESADKLDLKVISGLSWNRNYYSDGGRCKPFFEQTSPNIPFLQNALLYVGTCLLEGTNVSEGRGIHDYTMEHNLEPGAGAFMQFGAPWLDSEKIIEELVDSLQ